MTGSQLLVQPEDIVPIVLNALAPVQYISWLIPTLPQARFHLAQNRHDLSFRMAIFGHRPRLLFPDS
jgi:hypothetical protein